MCVCALCSMLGPRVPAFDNLKAIHCECRNGNLFTAFHFHLPWICLYTHTHHVNQSLAKWKIFFFLWKENVERKTWFAQEHTYTHTRVHHVGGEWKRSFNNIFMPHFQPYIDILKRIPKAMEHIAPYHRLIPTISHEPVRQPASQAAIVSTRLKWNNIDA